MSDPSFGLSGFSWKLPSSGLSALDLPPLPPAVAYRRPETAANRGWRSAAIEAAAEAIHRARPWLDGVAGEDLQDLRARLFDRAERREVFQRFAGAVIGLRDGVMADSRMTREAWRLLWRRLGRVGALEALAFAASGLRREPLIEAGRQRVLPLIQNNAVVDLVGWAEGEPDEWSTRTRAWPALVGHAWGSDSAFRLCRNPASWWRAGGRASAAVCLLDATEGEWAWTVQRALHLTCDDEDHAAAVERWLKARRPKLPKLWIAAGGEVA